LVRIGGIRTAIGFVFSITIPWNGKGSGSKNKTISSYNLV
jgi:hypothetical protein